MLPILTYGNGVMSESLDIISHLDEQNLLKVSEFVSSLEFKSFESLLNDIGNPIHSLAMPYWVYTPEFTPEARSYFQNKKEVKRGPFKELVKNQQLFIKELT